MDRVIAEHLAKVPEMDGQELRGLLAPVLSGVVIPALKTEAIGAAVIAQLPFARHLVIRQSGATWPGHARWSWWRRRQGWWWWWTS